MTRGPKAKSGRGRFLGRALQGLDEVLGLLEVRKVGRAGDRLHIAIGPGRKLVVQLVEVRQLVAGLVDLPIVWIAAQHDDIVGPVCNRHPGAHHRNVHEVGREAVLVLLIGHLLRVFGMLRS